MTKVKLLLVLAFLVVLAAGAVVGMAVDRQLRATAPTPEHHRRGGPLSELGLSGEQLTQWNAIWSPVNELRQKTFQTGQQPGQVRDQQIASLLTPEQMVRYKEIQAQFKAEMDARFKESQETYRKAEEEARKILTPEQRVKYDEIQKRFGGPGRRGGGPGRGGPGGRGSRDRSRPTTAPTTAPANPI